MRPTEAAGAITQTTHNDGSSISSRSYQIQPFRAAGACASAPHNISIANDSCHNCGLFVGSGNAENLSDLTEQDLPDELMLKEAYVDTFNVQCYNNIDPFYEYENGKTNINVKGRFKNSVHFWE